MSRVRTTPITETRKVGHTFTVALSEREVALLSYLLGRIPLSLLGYDTTLYDSLANVIEDDTVYWDDRHNILPGTQVDTDKIQERLEAYSNRYE